MNKYWMWLKKQKEGIGIGALVGLAAFFFYFYTAKLNSVIAMSAVNPTVFDTIAKPFLAIPTLQMATIKVALAFMLFGALIGLVLDAIFYPNK